jgi:glyoxylase-like metal-dependent hydrolase (beta-lactamase superfamily II)
MSATPSESNAELHVLQVGSGSPRVRSTVSLVLDGDHVVVIDPGMAPSQAAILDPLRSHGVEPGDVTDVVISHHHPDHTVNVGLFGDARVHDHWAYYQHDIWTSRSAEGFAVSPSVLLWETPGHTPQDITTLVGTVDGLVAATHLWWRADGPVEDPFATDPRALGQHRVRVLGVADLILPGHGPMFTPGDDTPR